MPKTPLPLTFLAGACIANFMNLAGTQDHLGYNDCFKNLISSWDSNNSFAWFLFLQYVLCYLRPQHILDYVQQLYFAKFGKDTPVNWNDAKQSKDMGEVLVSFCNKIFSNPFCLNLFFKHLDDAQHKTNGYQNIYAIKMVLSLKYCSKPCILTRLESKHQCYQFYIMLNKKGHVHVKDTYAHGFLSYGKYFSTMASNNEYVVSWRLMPKYFALLYLGQNPLRNIPCVFLPSMEIYAGKILKEIEHFTKTSLKSKQFIKPIDAQIIPQSETSWVKVGYKDFKCCGFKEDEAILDEKFTFGKTSTLCFMICAITMLQMGRPNMALIYQAEVVYSLEKIQKRDRHHYIVIFKSHCYAIMSLILLACFAPLENIINSWSCAIDGAKPEDFIPLGMVILECAKTFTGTHDWFWFDYKVLPRLVLSDIATFSILCQHVELLMEHLENNIVMNYCQKIYKYNFDDALSPDDVYRVIMRMRHIMSKYMKINVKATNMTLHKIHFKYLKYKLDVLSKFVEHCRFESVIHGGFINPLQDYQTKFSNLWSDPCITPNATLTSQIMLFYGFLSFKRGTFDATRIVLQEGLGFLMVRNQLVHSMDQANFLFTAGCLQLIDLHCNYPTKNSGLFQRALPHYQIASQGTSYRQSLVHTLAQLEKKDVVLPMSFIPSPKGTLFVQQAIEDLEQVVQVKNEIHSSNNDSKMESWPIFKCPSFFNAIADALKNHSD